MDRPPDTRIWGGLTTVSKPLCPMTQTSGNFTCAGEWGQHQGCPKGGAGMGCQAEAHMKGHAEERGSQPHSKWESKTGPQE